MKRTIIFYFLILSFFFTHTHTHTHTHRNKALKNQEFKTRDLKSKALKAQNIRSSNKSLSKDKSKLKVSFANVALYFIKNEGQYNKQALYYAKTPQYTLWVTKNGLVFDSVKRVGEKKAGKLGKKGDKPEDNNDKFIREVSRLNFIGANSKVRVSSIDKKELKVNYFKGKDKSKWKSAPTFAAVLYENVYPNIDLKVYGIGKQIEYDWIVKKGGNPDNIKFAYKGVKKSFINKNGDIEIHTGKIGKLIHKKPYSYQLAKNNENSNKEDKKIEVNSSFKALKDNSYCFKLGKYDKSKSLTIDPVVLLYSTYLGGGARDVGFGIAVGKAGYVYVTGFTQSSDFPTQGDYQGDQGGDDVFVAKLDTTKGKSGLLYSTYLGGGGNDRGNGIAVDEAGYVYVTGSTDSSNFPTKGAYDNNYGGNNRPDVFVSKLDTSKTGLNSLLYSTYLGGGGNDEGYAIAVDEAGIVYVTGGTISDNFPTEKKYQDNQEEADVFVAKLDTTKGESGLLYSTYLGGGSIDYGNGIAVGKAGIVYVTGNTDSSNFPTKGAYDNNYGGNNRYDVFVSKLDTSKIGKDSLLYSTYLGGGDGDYGNGIAVGKAGIVYVVGSTDSSDFPTKGAYNNNYGGNNRYDVFVSKLDTSKIGKDSLLYSTYLGGGDVDDGNGIAVDKEGYVYVTGSTYSTDFPTKGEYQGDMLVEAVFVSKLDTSKTGDDSLLYSTYFGGTNYDEGYAIAVYEAGNVYVTGNTDSLYYFPIKGKYQGYQGRTDVFVAKLGFEYTINASAGANGSVTPETQKVVNGKNAEITITPNTNYEIESIIDNGVAQPIANPYVIHNVQEDHNVVVKFIKLYDVQATVSGGNGSVSPLNQKVVKGKKATINITANTGYEIASITDNGNPQTISNPYVVNNVQANHNVVVTFKLKSYYVKAVVIGGQGSVNPAEQYVVEGKNSKPIIITPDKGYKIASIIDNGVAQAITSSYVIRNVRNRHLVEVTFKIPPTLLLQGLRKTVRSWTMKTSYAKLSITIKEADKYPMAIAKYVLYRELNGAWVELQTYPNAGTYNYVDKRILKKNEKAKYKLLAINTKGREVATSFLEL